MKNLTSSPYDVDTVSTLCITILHYSWRRVVILSVASPNEPKSRVFPQNAIQVGSSNGELVKIGKASWNKGHNVNKLTPEPPIKIDEIPSLFSITPQPIYHPLFEKKKEKIKEGLDKKYKELEESKPVLDVLENYMTYKKKLDEVMMGRARNSGAVIDMGSGTLSIDDGVIHHTYFPKPRAKAYLEIFEIDEEDHWLSFFEVRRDEDRNPKYGHVGRSFLDIEDKTERDLAMEAYLNPFKNIIVFKKLVYFFGSLPVQLKNTDWVNEGYGMYKNIEGDRAWHAKFEVITPSGRN
ncbi:hypothetical protein Tco_0603660 [Tanacetum coccineum]